jgi:hypothetical protein
LRDTFVTVFTSRSLGLPMSGVLKANLTTEVPWHRPLDLKSAQVLSWT